VFKAFLLFFSDPSQVEWFGWVMVGTICILDCFIVKISSMVQELQYRITSLGRAHIQRIVLEKSLTASSNEKIIAKMSRSLTSTSNLSAWCLSQL
jgi:hypothetical protein